MKIQIPEEYRQQVQDYSEYDYAPERTVNVTSFVNKVYALMCAALLVTAGVSWWTVNNLTTDVIITWMWPAMIAEFVMVLALNCLAHRLPMAISALAMLGYAALNGFTLSIFFLFYTKESLAGAFAVSAGIFGVMSLYGTVTRRDLISVGSLCFMALLGLILAGIVNIFLHSETLEFIASCFGVLVFTGLVAYDSQQIRRFGEAGNGNGSLAVLASLGLYLDFVNLFLYLVRLMGKRK